MMKKYAIGTDIGGSHISCGVIDIGAKKIISNSFTTQSVDNKASADIILNDWSTALQKSISKIDIHQLAGIGFAMPGPFDYEKGIALFEKVEKYYNLYNINVSERLRDSLKLPADFEVRYMNDATSFAVGEAWMGKASGADRLVCLTLGTGFGSAFIDNGIPVVERNDVPKLGCLWHLPFKNGIADDYFSTRWFINCYAEKTGKKLSGAKEIADLVTIDPEAKNVFIEFGQNLGGFLYQWLKMFHTKALVIGGNVSAAYNYYGSYFEETIKSLKVNIYISDLMEDAALIGSARLFDNNFWIRVKPLLSKM